MERNWLSYRRNWHLLWLFDLLLVGAWAAFLYKSPSPFGKQGEAAANAMVYMMFFGIFRSIWLAVLMLILLFKKHWMGSVLAAIHAAAWYILAYLFSILFLGAVGGH
jgi:hypothetical protein